MHAVKVHSSKPGFINKKNIEACILWDADKLTKLNSYTLLFNLFSKVFAKDCIENMNLDKYKTGQITIFELINNEIKPLLNEEAIDKFYFDVSNDRANKLRKILNSFYQTLIEHTGWREGIDGNM